MIKASTFTDTAKEFGYDFYCGVPCSFLKPLINHTLQSDDIEYFAASNEGEAIAVGAGAQLAGRKSIVMFQNAGLGNTVNPLTSLCFTFRIPILLVVTLRGEVGLGDEPQHELMGLITTDLLDTMKIGWEWFPTETEKVSLLFEKAKNHMNQTGLPFAFVMRKSSVGSVPLTKTFLKAPRPGITVNGQFQLKVDQRKDRMEALRFITAATHESDAVIATTGKIGREVFSINDKNSNFYMVGSMGLASALGLGLSLARTSGRTVILDGDGALLMHMGSLGTLGYYGPSEIVHIVIDNETYESTGGQFSVSSTVDFCSVAAACGYASAWRVDTETAIKDALDKTSGVIGPHLIHIKVADGSAVSLGRPNIKPTQIAERFRKFLRQRIAN
ncbi:MAG TPA: phosphonopyruvate decarboxylase [Nitrospinota bacterium]|nr:phosphonopyruvate decarboxylase [Nitrospinota bacterium]